MTMASSRAAASAPRRARFTLKGTVHQRDCWQRGIVRRIEREATDLRRQASRLERLCARLRAVRESGREFGWQQIADATNAVDSTRYYVGKLLGFKTWASRDQIFGVLIAPSLAQPAPPPVESTVARVEPTSVGAFEQAVLIARSASGSIDWSREPLTERERKVRARWIERHMDESPNLLICRIISLKLKQRFLPSDLDAAYTEATALADAARQADEEQERADIIAEIESEESDG